MNLAVRLIFGMALAGGLFAQDGAAVTGERKQWHKVTLTLDGPEASEAGTPNPFLDYRLTVTFTHSSGSPRYSVPGYFAADGNAGNTSAAAGNKWRTHLAPDKAGRWNYEVSFVRGPGVAVDAKAPGEAVAGVDGKKGSFTIGASDKHGRDFRGKGRLQYAGENYLRFAGTGEYFLKAGADSPETLLAYEDFDGTITRKVPLKKYASHLGDWKAGDPTWKEGKGKGLIGAVNYLSSKGVNSMSFLTYNAGGDGDNVWPYIEPGDKLRMDCSKLDQWQIVFDHAQSKGLHLHFKLQEQENDDNRIGNGQREGKVPASMDGGALGVERKLYLRELIARYGYELALNWNLGEENTQSAAEQRDMSGYIKDTDPYVHHIVVHTFPNWQDKVYPELVGEKSVLTGASLQMMWDAAHQRTLHWLRVSEKTGRRWVVANDEQGSASHGVPPDLGYKGYDGKDRTGKVIHTLHDIRKKTLWGNLMAGGAGVEYYFGYLLPENDLLMEDFRSRDKSWDYARIALEFFAANKVPFWQMRSADELIGSAEGSNAKYAFVKPGEVYVVYLPGGGTTDLDLKAAPGNFRVDWYNPRAGGALSKGSVVAIKGGTAASIGQPPADASEDWVALVRKR
ncbi:MAG: DUF5060 domain-containing protein [Acidobacteriota bacterium]